MIPEKHGTENIDMSIFDTFEMYALFIILSHKEVFSREVKSYLKIDFIIFNTDIYITNVHALYEITCSIFCGNSFNEGMI